MGYGLIRVDEHLILLPSGQMNSKVRFLRKMYHLRFQGRENSRRLTERSACEKCGLMKANRSLQGTVNASTEVSPLYLRGLGEHQWSDYCTGIHISAFVFPYTVFQ